MGNIKEMNLYEYTEQKIMSHYQNNPEFNKTFIRMERYYQTKLAFNVKESHLEKFKELFFSGSKAQFFNGYFIIQELLSKEDTQIEDDWLTQPEGYITQQIPQLIRDITNEEDEVIYSPDMRKFKMWMITTYEDVLNDLNQTAFDILCHGAKQALLDLRDKRGLEPFDEKESIGILSNFKDFNFITPQVFLDIHLPSQTMESWNLHFWDSINTSDIKAGEVTLITITEDVKIIYDLNILLSTRISENERGVIIESILFSVMERNDIPRENIMLRYATVEDFYVFIQN